MFERFTPAATRSVSFALAFAKEEGEPSIRPIHLVRGGLAADSHVAVAVLRLGVAPCVAERMLAPERTDSPRSDPREGRPKQLPFARPTKRALERALRIAIDLGHRSISAAHILGGALEVEAEAEHAQRLGALGVTGERLRDCLAAVAPEGAAAESVRAFRAAFPHPSDQPDQVETAGRLFSMLYDEHEFGAAIEFAAALSPIEVASEFAFRAAAAAECLGDAGRMLQTARDLMVRHEKAPAWLHGTAALALALGGNSDQARDELARRGESDDPYEQFASLLDAAETHTLLTDLDAARVCIDRADTALEDLSIAGIGVHLLTRAWAGLTEPGEIARFRSSYPSAETVAESFVFTRLDVALAAELLEAGSRRQATKAARRAVDAATEHGFQGVRVDALETLAQATNNTRKRREIATEAAREADALGRAVQARRVAAVASG